MGLFSFKNKREEENLVADLDALVADPVHFVFQGQTHRINPLSTLECIKFANAQARLHKVLAAQTVTPAEIRQTAFDLVASVCPTITMKHIDTMTEAQIGALLNIVYQHATGSPGMAHEKKKTTRMMG